MPTRETYCTSLELILIFCGHTPTWRVVDRAGHREEWLAYRNADAAGVCKPYEVALYRDGTTGGSPEFVLGERGALVKRILAGLGALGWELSEVSPEGVFLVPVPPV